MALLAPSIDSKVRRMRSSRHWVRTWIVTPSGNEVVFDQLTHEVEVGLRRSGEADLDLSEADLDETVPHATLAHGVHRVDQRLVAVAEIDRAPDRGGLEPLVRPGAIGKLHGRVGPVLLEGHGAPTWR
jgi:hypothetical protein